MECGNVNQKYTPKEYEIVIVEIIRENGETIVDTAIGPNSISRIVFDNYGIRFHNWAV